MPVVTSPRDSKIRMRLKTGVDVDGKDILTTKTYSNIKDTATDEDVYAVANEILNLQQYPCTSLLRVDEKELTEQA